MSNSFQYSPNRTSALDAGLAVLLRPDWRQSGDYVRPPLTGLTIHAGRFLDRMSAVAMRGWRRNARWYPGKKARWLATGCALVMCVTSTPHPAIAQEPSPKVHLATFGLPAIETLTFNSDYSVFMAPGVPRDIRRRALRKLWSFPFFNETDGLLTYAGDYAVTREPQAKRAMSALSGPRAGQATTQ